jgi:CRP-like cAMP-binding protein
MACFRRNGASAALLSTRQSGRLLGVQQFERIVNDELRYFRVFADLLFERFARLFRYLAEGNKLSQVDWLCTRLAEALRRHDLPSGSPVDLTLSQEELANMVGVSRQTLNALLAQRAERRLIEVRFRRLRVLDEAGLRGGYSCGQG